MAFWRLYASLLLDPIGFGKGRQDAKPSGLGEAKAIVRAFAAQTAKIPAHVGMEMTGLLEALVGGSETVQLFAQALSAQGAEAWTVDRPALAAAVFELGFVLRRCGAKGDGARAALSEARRDGRGNDVARALDLVLHGRAGAERCARAELDYAHATDDAAWVRDRLVDPATAASPIDVALVPLGGDGLMGKWRSQLAAAADARWLATQLCVLGGDQAAALVVGLYAERKDARDTLKAKCAENAGAGRAALEGIAGGPDGARAFVGAGQVAKGPGGGLRLNADRLSPYQSRRSRLATPVPRFGDSLTPRERGDSPFAARERAASKAPPRFRIACAGVRVAS